MASLLRYSRLTSIARNLRKFSSQGPSAGEHGAASTELWRKLSLYGALPAVAIVTAIIFYEELNHEHSRPEFKPYEHLRIRTKAFPWRDGQKTLLHNPHTNALPTGYEDEQ